MENKNALLEQSMNIILPRLAFRSNNSIIIDIIQLIAPFLLDGISQKPGQEQEQTWLVQS